MLGETCSAAQLSFKVKMSYQEPAITAKAGVLELCIYKLSFKFVKNSQIFKAESCTGACYFSLVYVPAHSALNCVDSPGDNMLEWQLKANLDGQRFFAAGYDAGTP